MSERLLTARGLAELAAAPLGSVGEEPAAELGERPVPLLEDGEDRLALRDREGDRREPEREPARDERRGGLGDVAAVSGERGDEAARVRFGDGDAVEAEHAGEPTGPV